MSSTVSTRQRIFSLYCIWIWLDFVLAAWYGWLNLTCIFELVLVFVTIVSFLCRRKAVLISWSHEQIYGSEGTCRANARLQVTASHRQHRYSGEDLCRSSSPIFDYWLHCHLIMWPYPGWISFCISFSRAAKGQWSDIACWTESAACTLHSLQPSFDVLLHCWLVNVSIEILLATGQLVLDCDQFPDTSWAPSTLNSVQILEWLLALSCALPHCSVPWREKRQSSTLLTCWKRSGKKTMISKMKWKVLWTYSRWDVTSVHARNLSRNAIHSEVVPPSTMTLWVYLLSLSSRSLSKFAVQKCHHLR